VNIIEHLRTVLVELDVERKAVVLSLARIDEARDGLERLITSVAAVPVAAPVVEQVKRPAADPIPKRTPRAVEMPCPEPGCGFVGKNALSLATHRSRGHKGPKPPLGPLAASVATITPPAPAAPVEARPRPHLTDPGTLPNGKVLACTERDCGETFGGILFLVSHTEAVHGRQPYREERVPVSAEVAP
jgi:hypothetical protein